MTLIVTPDTTVPIPFAAERDLPEDIHARAQLAFQTIEFLVENGLEVPDITPEEHQQARYLFTDSPLADKKQLRATGTALALKMLMDEYDVEVVRTAAQMRNYVMVRLVMLSDSAKEATQLKALELLGKMSDVNAFAENVNVSVTHKTKEDLEAELAKKLSTYLDDVQIEDATIINPTDEPLSDDHRLRLAPGAGVLSLDAELGFTGGETVEAMIADADRMPGRGSMSE